jgi:predicted enzyme related to lactoylglutathione lyase
MDINYRGIIWAGIHVENLELAIRFYRDTLGLSLLGGNAHYAHFDAGADGLLELFSGGKSSPSPKGPKAQSTMVALRVENLAFTEEILRKRGVRFTENSGTFENMSWSTLVDPEGNCIEIKQISEA